MKRLALGGIALAAAALAAAPATAASASGHRTGAAVFVQTDNTDGNSIVAYDRSADGSLRQSGSYRTGGRGGVLDGAVVDHLASQGSLALDRRHGLLYAVNAGSDTVTVFGVDGDRLARRQVIGSGGSFPVSVAVYGDLVYVLNARDGGSVQGFRWSGDRLVRVPGWHRGLGLDPTQTPEFTHTPGQVAFTPDGTKLVVTTKAGANTIDVYRVDGSGGLSARPVVTADPDAVPFAVAFDQAGRLVVAEAGPNAVATFRVNADGTLTTVGRTATGQAATCWIAGTGALLYTGNAGSATISGFRTTATAPAPIGTTATDPGTVDLAVTGNGRYLYAQTGATGTVDEFAVGTDGTLHSVGSVVVPNAVGGEGIAAS